LRVDVQPRGTASPRRAASIVAMSIFFIGIMLVLLV
jgi:hypothetical protein